MWILFDKSVTTIYAIWRGEEESVSATDAVFFVHHTNVQHMTASLTRTRRAKPKHRGSFQTNGGYYLDGTFNPRWSQNCFLAWAASEFNDAKMNILQGEIYQIILFPGSRLVTLSISWAPTGRVYCHGKAGNGSTMENVLDLFVEAWRSAATSAPGRLLSPAKMFLSPSAAPVEEQSPSGRRTRPPAKLREPNLAVEIITKPGGPLTDFLMARFTADSKLKLALANEQNPSAMAILEARANGRLAILEWGLKSQSPIQQNAVLVKIRAIPHTS